VKRPPDQDENPGEPVLQNVLEGKAERDRADAEAGKDVNRPHRGQDDGDHDQKAEEDDAPERKAAQDVAQIVPPGPAQDVAQQFRRRERDAEEEQRDEEADNEIRQDVEKAGNPVVEMLVKCAQCVGHEKAPWWNRGEGAPTTGQQFERFRRDSFGGRQRL
jgi:FtsZ-interacting cell division protein ZipA